MPNSGAKRLKEKRLKMAAMRVNIFRTACYVTRYVTCIPRTLLVWAKWAWVCRDECRWNAQCCTGERETEVHNMLIAQFPNISAYVFQTVSLSMYIRTVKLTGSQQLSCSIKQNGSFSYPIRGAIMFITFSKIQYLMCISVDYCLSTKNTCMHIGTRVCALGHIPNSNPTVP
jgi:hypothetical protein